MAPAFAAQFAEVEVDTATGQVGVVRIVSAQDVGRAINPAVVVGQIHGAVVQGLGYALSEDLVVDRDTGTVLAGTFGDYAISTAADVPPIDVVLVEDPDPTGPYGARGAGEPAITLTAPAIANAVLDALGTAPTTLPLTPDVVRAAAERSRATLAARAGIEAPRESSPA
jgi:xanthine dehydrogenase molybdenum-binding subunit